MAAKKSPAKKAPVKKASSKKPAPRKKKGGKKNPPRSLGGELKKVVLGIGILLAICLTAAMLADILINSGTTPHKAVKVAKEKTAETPARPAAKPGPKTEAKAGSEDADPMSPVVADIAELHTKKKADGLKEKNGHPIVYEVFDHVEHDRGKPGVRPGKGDEAMPQIAIIIDDIGYDKKVAMGLLDLNTEITFSVLPFSPFGKTLAKRLKNGGAELMLHLPMEPVQYPKVNPGPGALLTGMAPDELLNQLRKDLDNIPGIIGVNNHMGSKLTTHADQMNQIFTILRKRDLFFVDSRTAADSKGHAAARLLQLRFSQRDVFLDNVQKVDYITGQFHQLLKIAEKHGTAIGIGHPYEATLEALKIELPKLKNRIKVVRASRLVAIPG